MMKRGGKRIRREKKREEKEREKKEPTDYLKCGVGLNEVTHPPGVQARERKNSRSPK
jgi:hypothetical protein